jgi:hypothetical protein
MRANTWLLTFGSCSSELASTLSRSGGSVLDGRKLNLK